MSRATGLVFPDQSVCHSCTGEQHDRVSGEGYNLSETHEQLEKAVVR